jgi:peroxiredoxin
MKLKPIILLTLLCPVLLSFSAEPYTINGTIRGIPSKKVYLSAFYGEKTTVVDSAVTDLNGTLSITLRQGLLPGLYRVTWGKDRFFDLILNNENIRFTTAAENSPDSMQIQSSVENTLFYDYMRKDRLNQAKLEILIQVLDFYPQRDDFYALAVGKYESIQHAQEGWLDSVTRLHPRSYALRLFRLQEPPFLAASLSKEARIAYLKAHFFDHADFQDTAMLRSNGWANKSIAYLSLYGNSQYNQKQLEAEFIKAVTILMSAASVNADIYKFLLDYLVGGFDKYHFDEVITYMADHFQDPYSCEDQARKTALQKKLETFKKISIGKTAPDIDVPDMKGKTVTLSGIQSEYTVLIFWSSECPHCTEMMPKVKEVYDRQKPKRFEILAVSLDTSRTEWTTFIRTEKLNWINASDLKGFDGKAADQYNIFATPTMFLLDREKKILAKPISYRELEQALKENKLIN